MSSGVPVTLLVLYSLLGCHVLGQIVLLIRQKHKPFSYKAVFNWFALVWMLFRAIFWGIATTTATINDALYYLLFWFPHCILYMTFATLALFFSKVIHRREWTGRYRNKFLLSYGLFGLLDFVGTIAISVLAGQNDGANSDTYGDIESLGSGLLFLLLAGIYVMLGISLRNLENWEYNRMFMFQPKTTAAVAFTLAFTFASRCLWNFLTYANVVVVEIGDDSPRDDAIIIIAYLVWEFFPIILLLSTIATGPVGKGKQTAAKETLSLGVFGAIDAMEAEHDAGEEDRMLQDEASDTVAHTIDLTPSRLDSYGRNAPQPGMANGFATSANSAPQLPIPSSSGSGGLGVPGGAGLGRPGGFTSTFGSDVGSFGGPSHETHGSMFPEGSARVGSAGSSRGPMLSGSGFFSAQQNAVKRSTYIPPSPSGMATSGPRNSPMITGRAGPSMFSSPAISGYNQHQGTPMSMVYASPSTPIAHLLYDQRGPDGATLAVAYATTGQSDQGVIHTSNPGHFPRQYN